MSTTPDTPPPLTYPDADNHGIHRLAAVVVALIIAVVVLAAAAVTIGVVLFVLAKKSPAPTPPDPSGIVVGPTATATPEAATPTSTPTATPSASPTTTPTTSPTSSTSPPTTTPASSPASSKITLGPGISLTIADGWVLDGYLADNSAWLFQRSIPARLEIAVGTGKSKDAKVQLDYDLQELAEHSLLRNVKIEHCRSEALDSRQFQQDDKCPFTADFVTDQGSLSVVGMVIELMNNTSGMGALAVVYAPDNDRFAAAAPDASAMINSML